MAYSLNEETIEFITIDMKRKPHHERDYQRANKRIGICGYRAYLIYTSFGNWSDLRLYYEHNRLQLI